MELWQDLRYAVRRLWEARWFTLAAVSALGMGIGANTTVFTFVNAVLFRGLPFEDPDRIMALWTTNPEGQQVGGLSYPDYQDLRDRTRSFEHLAAVLNASVNISDDEEMPERVEGAYVTGNFFRMLGEEPALGRGFRDDDDLPGAEPVVMLGHSVWENRYGGSPDALGRSVRVNSLVATVVGVMPPDMRFPNNNDIWIPQVNLPPETGTGNRGTRSFSGIGRLAGGVTVEQARQELVTLGRSLAETYPETNEDLRPDLMSFQERANGSEIRIIFLSLLGAVAFVLLIACANVASLLLAKSMERAREIAVRISLGATRGRIVRQLLVESVLVAAISGAVGLGLSVLGIRWFDGVTQNVGKPYWMEFTMDPVVFGYMAAVCLATAVLFGLAPALHVSKTDVNEVLKEGTRGGSGGLRSRRWSGALIVGELVLTLVLLSGAGFMMQSFMTLYRMDVGVETEGLLTMQIYLPLTKYPEMEPRNTVYREFLDRLGGLTAIEASALTTAFPMSGGGLTGVELDGRETESGADPPPVTLLSVSEDYFDALRVELLRGRTFNREDGLPGSRVAIVNQRFVDLHLAGGDPLGRTVRVGFENSPLPEAPWLTVVGVAPTIRQRGAQEREPDPVVYLPLQQNPSRATFLMVRSRGDVAGVSSAVREAMQVVEPDLPLFNITTLEQQLAQARWPFRVFGTMFSLFAGIALALSAIGLYSVTANSVIQRIREFGIRVSLGAEPRQISWLALRRVLGQLAIGLPLGMVGAYGVGRLLESLLVQSGPGDPVTLGAVVLVMAGVAILACLWPARRAARIDPVTALRVE